jgi:hypothetical protein
MLFNPVEHVINLDSIEKYFQTTEELILNTFNEDELNLIQTDVTYYIKDTNIIKNTEALKKKKMKDILLSEGDMYEKEIKNSSNNKLFKNKSSNSFLNSSKNKTYFDPQINNKANEPNSTATNKSNSKVKGSTNGNSDQISNQKKNRIKTTNPYESQKPLNKDLFNKTNFYHLYDTGIEKDHQRIDIITNKYNELYYEIDKNLMKYNVKENLVDDKIEYINRKIHNDILIRPYSKNPKATICNFSNENLPISQFHTFYANKTKERNNTFDKKALKIRKD